MPATPEGVYPDTGGCCGAPSGALAELADNAESVSSRRVVTERVKVVRRSTAGGARVAIDEALSACGRFHPRQAHVHDGVRTDVLRAVIAVTDPGKVLKKPLPAAK